MCLQRALVRGQTPTSTTAFDRWVERLHKSERLETSCYQSTTAFDRALGRNIEDDGCTEAEPAVKPEAREEE